jgi:hypothetical protein
MNQKTLLIIGAVVAAVAGLIIYSSSMLGGMTVEVCKQFQGRQACGTGVGPTETEAISTATQVACAKIASGMTDSNTCQMSNPIRVKWLKK